MKTQAPAKVSAAFVSDDPFASFVHFRPIVEAIALDQIHVCNQDVALIRVNVERGVTAFEQHLDLIQKKMPAVAANDIRELPALCLALLYASDRVAVALSSGDIANRLAQLRPLREVALLQLEVFAQLGLVPAERVAAIRAGTGPLDAARDAVSIFGMFQEFSAQVAGKHPIAEEQLGALNTLGKSLIAVLRPKNAVADASEVNPEATLRDRFFTEVLRRHDELRDAGAAAVGVRKLDESFPPLATRTATPATPAAPSEKPAAPPEGAVPG